MRQLRAAVDVARVFGPGAFCANENGGLQRRGRTGCLVPEVLFASVTPGWALLSLRARRGGRL